MARLGAPHPAARHSALRRLVDVACPRFSSGFLESFHEWSAHLMSLLRHRSKISRSNKPHTVRSAVTTRTTSNIPRRSLCDIYGQVGVLLLEAASSLTHSPPPALWYHRTLPPAPRPAAPACNLPRLGAPRGVRSEGAVARLAKGVLTGLRASRQTCRCVHQPVTICHSCCAFLRNELVSKDSSATTADWYCCLRDALYVAIRQGAANPPGF